MRRAHRDRPTPALATAMAAATLAIALAACAPPETQRVRGGDRGADIGNRSPTVVMHGGSEIYADRRCAVQGADCTGPIPRAGRARDIPPHPPAIEPTDPHVLGEMGRGGRVRPVIYTPPPWLGIPEDAQIEPPFPGPETGPGSDDPVDPAR